jgi:hypothetical protein
MKVNDWLEVIDYKVESGNKFEWECFGDEAYCLDYFIFTHDYTDYFSSICFDTKTKEIYYVEILDENNTIYYGWHNPKYVQQYEDECIKRNIDFAPPEYNKIFKFSYSEILEVLKSIHNNH